MSNIITPANMWREFEESAPINASLFNSYNVGSIRINETFLNGRRDGNTVTRVFCVTATPQRGGKLPAVIVMNDIEKGISSEKLFTWAREGYIAVGIDFRGSNTIYPEGLSYCEYSEKSRAHLFVDNTATDTAWYNYAFNVRSVINYIYTLPEFDGRGCFLYSLRNADKIALMTAAADKRIITSALIFGELWESLPFKQNITEDNLHEQIENQDERARYFAAIAPQSQLPLITSPLLAVQGTNSRRTDMSRLTEAVKSARNEGKTTVILLPRIIDAMLAAEENIARRWFLNYGRHPKTITASVRISDGRLLAAMNADGAPQSAVSIYYSRGNMHQSMRNWCRAKESFSEGEYVADIDIVNPDEPVIVLFNVIDNYSEVSTRVINVTPSELKGVTVFAEKTKVIYNGKRNVGDYIPLSPFEPQTVSFIESHPILYAEGSLNMGGVKGTALTCFCMNDSMFIREEGSALTFDINSLTEQELTVAITIGADSGNPTVYQFSTTLAGGDFWEKISLSPHSFKSQFGKTLDTINQPALLSFVAKREIILNNIRFT